MKALGPDHECTRHRPPAPRAPAAKPYWWFPPFRLRDGTGFAVVKGGFANHQGMGSVALCNVIGGFAMRRRFHAAPLVQAAELLLRERTPRHVTVARAHTDEAAMHLHVREVGSPGWEFALLFRDWLRAEASERDAYASVKADLAGGLATTEEYAEAKEPWFTEAWPRARAWARRTGWTAPTPPRSPASPPSTRASVPGSRTGASSPGSTTPSEG